MLWQYLGELLSFAFRRTTLAVDSLQILAASAIPALADWAGVKMAPDISTQTLAYIGAIVVVWVGLRLICAPYFIWKGQVGEIGTLRYELAKPERLEEEVLRRKRVKYRLKLAAEMSRYCHAVVVYQGRRDANAQIPLHAHIAPIVGRAGVSRYVEQAYARAIRASHLSHNAMLAKDDALCEKIADDMIHMVRGIRDVIHGEMTDAELGIYLATHPRVEG